MERGLGRDRTKAQSHCNSPDVPGQREQCELAKLRVRRDLLLRPDK